MKPSAEEMSTLALYAEGPTRLDDALAGLSEVDLDASPSQGGWSLRQLVHHIVDGDDIWKMCIKSALGNDKIETTLEWYGAQSQDVWADRWAYASRSIAVSLALFKANRAHVLQLLEQVPDAWQQPIRMRMPDGRTEQMIVGTAISIQAKHVIHHTERIHAIRAEHGGL
jgi:uncharacterized damage-inducible protein DinB